MGTVSVSIVMIGMLTMDVVFAVMLTMDVVFAVVFTVSMITGHVSSHPFGHFSVHMVGPGRHVRSRIGSHVLCADHSCGSSQCDTNRDHDR